MRISWVEVMHGGVLWHGVLASLLLLSLFLSLHIFILVRDMGVSILLAIILA